MINFLIKMVRKLKKIFKIMNKTLIIIIVFQIKKVVHKDFPLDFLKFKIQIVVKIILNKIICIKPNNSNISNTYRKVQILEST